MRLIVIALMLTAPELLACGSPGSRDAGGSPTDPPRPATAKLMPAPGPDLPFVVPAPQRGHAPFADFAWREFIALNWPSRIDGSGTPVRGAPDRALQVGDALNRPRVWETWKTNWELMGFGGPNPPQPSDWTDWNTPDIAACPGMTVPPGMKVLTSRGATTTRVRGLNQAFIGPLIDQARNYARYEVHIGENEYTAIRTKKWFIAANLPGVITLDASTPGNYGAIELKAAWRELPAGSDGSRFYTVSALMLDPGMAQCVRTRVALVGLHIAHKTDPFSEWVWSTFEHVDNVPPNPPGTPQSGVHYSFNNGATTPASPDGFDRVPRSLVAGASLPAPADPERNPVQVTRFEPTPQEIVLANQAFRNEPSIARTVWANYLLVNNQWPTDAGSFKIGGKYPDEAGKPFPETRVANATMESYFQNRNVSEAVNSCLACHYIGAAKDFSFVFLEAWRPPSPGLRPDDATSKELRALEEAIRKARPSGVHNRPTDATPAVPR